MKIKDFESAMPGGITVDSFKCKKGEVIWCLAHRLKDAAPIIYDKDGRAWSRDKEMQASPVPFMCLVHRGYSAMLGYAFDIRIPELDLKFRR